MAFRPILTNAATTSRKFIPLSITRTRPLVIPAATTHALAFHRAYSNKATDAEEEEVKQKRGGPGSVLHSEFSQQQKVFDTRLKKIGERVEQVEEKIEVTLQQRLDNHAGGFSLLRKMLEDFQGMNMAQGSRIDGIHRRQEEFAEDLGRKSLDLVEVEKDIVSHKRKIAGLEDIQSSLEESVDTKLEELEEKFEELTTEKESGNSEISSQVTEVREQLDSLKNTVAMRCEDCTSHFTQYSYDIEHIQSNLERLNSQAKDYQTCFAHDVVKTKDLEQVRVEIAKVKELTLRLEEQISGVKQLRSDVEKAPTKQEVFELLTPQNVHLREHDQQLSGLDRDVSEHTDEIAVLKAHVRNLLDGLKQTLEKNHQKQDLRYDDLLCRSSRCYNKIQDQLQAQSSHIAAIRRLYDDSRLSIMSRIESIENKQVLEKEKCREQKQNKIEKIKLWAKRVKVRHMFTNPLVVCGATLAYACSIIFLMH
ncbi:hypothetical protein BDD12DRAFT_872798 [Trichophaea hybrida]|nr:hypothetical protein BDD12DRAFT_872798 [Trichophaea hybrida]